MSLAITYLLTNHTYINNRWQILLPAITYLLISHTLVDYKIAGHSDVFGALPVGYSQLDTWLQWIGQRQLQDQTRNIEVLEFGATYIKGLTMGCILLTNEIIWSAKGTKSCSYEIP